MTKDIEHEMELSHRKDVFKILSYTLHSVSMKYSPCLLGNSCPQKSKYSDGNINVPCRHEVASIA